MLNKVHLSEQEVAQCADAINGNAFNRLPEELREHLAHCDECASEVLTVADMAFDFSAHSNKSKISQIYIGRKFAIFSSAAAVIIFVGILFTQQQFLSKPSDVKLADADTTSSQAADSVLINDKFASASNQPEQSDSIKQSYIDKEKDSKNIILASYQPNAEIEKLFNNYASAYRGDDISVISDRIVRIPGNDSLKWRNPSNEVLNVDIFNNQGTRILTFSCNTNGIKIPELNAGLYYWKLINQDFDLLFIGKMVFD